MNAAVTVDDVAKRFRVYHERNQTLKSAVMRRRTAVYEEFWALKGVSFEIPEGSTFGLVGDNGSGKSTLLKILAQILYPDRGQVTARGRVAALLEVGSGFHPELSGRENVFLNGSILGMSKAEITRKFDEIVDFAGVEQFIDQPVKNYSSGMYVRLGFAVAINVDPDVLLVDEVLAVGDAAFQDKCTEKFGDFRRAGRTVVVVSHAMSSLRAMCDQAAWLDHGTLVESGDASGVLERYLDSTRSGLRAGPGGSVHSGTGEALIDDVELVQDGRRVDTVISGEPLTVRIHYTSHQRILGPVFGLAIDTHDGQLLWGNNTRDARHAIEVIDGSGVVEYTVPRLTLQPGTFHITAAVVDSTNTHVFDYVTHAARLHVTGSTPADSSGSMVLGGAWQWLG